MKQHTHWRLVEEAISETAAGTGHGTGIAGEEEEEDDSSSSSSSREEEEEEASDRIAGEEEEEDSFVLNDTIQGPRANNVTVLWLQ